MSAKDMNVGLKAPEQLFTFLNTNPQNITPKALPKIDTNLVSYFQPWINFCYYMLFIPFKIVNNNNNFYVRTNTFQKILCSILHPIICVNAYFEFHEKFVQKIRDTPEIFMRALERFNTILFCFLFFYTVWFKKASVLAICNHSSSQVIPRKVNRNRKVVFYCIAVLSNSIIAFVTLTFDLENLGLTKGFQQLIQKFRFEYYLTRHLETEIHDVQITQLSTVLSAVAIFFRLYKWILMDFIISLTVLTGFVSYKVSKQFKEILMEESSLLKSGDWENQILEMYSEMISTFNKLNDLIGPILAVVFLFTTTFCAVHTIDLLDSEELGLPILMTCYILFLFLAMAFSAEARHQATYMKTWLLSRHRNGQTVTNLIGYMLEVEQCNLAIKGGRCFTITYSFLGTASSVVLTYAIIMIQFGGGRTYSNVSTV